MFVRFDNTVPKQSYTVTRPLRPTGPMEQVDPVKLQQIIVAHFSDDELRQFCFELSMDFDDLPGSRKSDKARGLVELYRRQRRLEQLAEAVLRQRQHVEPHTFILDTRTDESPFKGLQYFDEADAHLFFGREQLTADLVNYVSEHPVLAVVGASGSGKSSLVRAGLVPAMREQGYCIHVITPTAHPLKALASSLTRDSESVTAAATLMDDMARDGRSLDLYAHKLLAGADEQNLLLVVDQFEELFTLCKDEAARRAFIDNLLAALYPESPLKVAFTLRADFYHHCAQYDGLREVLEARQKYIGPMSLAELRQAIELPAQSSGLRFEEGLVDLLLRDVGDEPGALPLLSHALLETWRRREGDVLTLAGYTAAGGIQGAIAKTADSVYQRLSSEQQAIARNIFLRLTELGEGTQDTRRRAALDELIPSGDGALAMTGVLKTLADARLVTTHEDAAEVAHEALIREWPALRQWLDENREGLRLHRQLTEAAQAWEASDRNDSYLYRGARLEAAREWTETDVAPLSVLEQAFLAASQAHYQDELAQARAQAQREADAAHKLRQRALFLYGALVIVAALATVAFLLFGRANDSARDARDAQELAFTRESEAIQAQETAVAEGNARATQEVRVIDSANLAVARAAEAEAAEATAVFNQQLALTREAETSRQRRIGLAQSVADLSQTVYQDRYDSELAALLAIEAYRINREETGNAAWLADSALRPLLGHGPPFFNHTLRGHENSVWSVAFSPDGQTLASGSEDRTVRLWDLTQPGAEPVVLAGHENWVISVAFSPDGQTLASGSGDRTVRLWDLTQPGAEPVVLPGHEDSVWSVAFSLDGQTLASGSADRTVRLWDLTQPGAEPVVLPGHENSVISVAFSPDGQTLASGSGDRTVRLWDLTQPGAEPVVLAGHEGSVWSVAFSPDGQTLASGSEDRTVRLWLLLDRLVEIGCQKVRRNFTWAEWQRYLSDEPYRQTCPNLPVHPSVPQDQLP